MHKNIQREPSTWLTTLSSPVPFIRWGLDIVGPLPIASKKRKFIFVAVNYFTKWVEVEPVSTISGKMVVNLVFRNIVFKFGTPIQIIGHGLQARR